MKDTGTRAITDSVCESREYIIYSKAIKLLPLGILMLQMILRSSWVQVLMSLITEGGSRCFVTYSSTVSQHILGRYDIPILVMFYFNC